MCRLDYIDVFSEVQRPVSNRIFSDSVHADQRPEWFEQRADGTWVMREDAFEYFIGQCFLNQLQRARTLSADYRICTPPHPGLMTWATPMYVFVQVTLCMGTCRSIGSHGLPVNICRQ